MFLEPVVTKSMRTCLIFFWEDGRGEWMVDDQPRVGVFLVGFFSHLKRDYHLRICLNFMRAATINCHLAGL